MRHWESTYGLGHVSPQAIPRHNVIPRDTAERLLVLVCLQNYILNLPPSKAGIIEPNMAAAASSFGVERHRRYGTGSSAPDEKSECELGRAGGRLAQWSPEAADAELVLHLGKPSIVDRIFMSEDVLSDGQLVGNYTVEACSAAAIAGCGTGDTNGASWATIVGPESTKGGRTIGTHHIDLVNATGVSFLRLRLLEVVPASVLPLLSFRALRVGA